MSAFGSLQKFRGANTGSYLNDFVVVPPVTSVTLTGDVTGTTSANTVTQVQGKPYSSTVTNAGAVGGPIPDGDITARANVNNGSNTISYTRSTIQMGNVNLVWTKAELQLNAGTGGTQTGATIAVGALPPVNVAQRVNCRFNDTINYAGTASLSLQGYIIINNDGSFVVNLGLIGTGLLQRIEFEYFDAESI